MCIYFSLHLPPSVGNSGPPKGRIPGIGHQREHYVKEGLDKAFVGDNLCV